MLSVFSLTPKQAAAWFKAKIVKPSMSWRDFRGSEHNNAFVVSKITNLDLLLDVQAELLKAIETGTTVTEFAKNIKPAMDAKGWGGSFSRLENIFRNNLSTAYAAQYQDSTGGRGGFYLYDAIDDGRVRPLHKSWDGLILPVGSPFWKTHYPPNGWRCRCTVIWLKQSGLKRHGRSKPNAEPKIKYTSWKNPDTGKSERVPVGIDPGWDYRPGGAGRAQALKDALKKKEAQAKKAGGK